MGSTDAAVAATNAVVAADEAHKAARLAQPQPARTVALCVCGSIAAYKAVEVARLLVRQGVRVLPVMTASGAQFVGPVTLAGICGEPVASNMWDASFAGELHVDLANRADVIAIVPATADVLARLAQGRADDLVTALALCARGPVLAAPAMHPRMWSHPAVQQNVAALAAQRRVSLVGPVHGEVASGDVGLGRMAEPEAVAEAIVALTTPRDLAGMRVVVTAGPTLEDIDPVRFIGNRSTGKMGFAVAARAAARGAQVTLVAGPVTLSTPAGVLRVDVRSAVQMGEALLEVLGKDLSRADALVMAAAVADHRPAVRGTKKIKKAEHASTIELLKNPDLLGEIGQTRAANKPILVGFAVETEGGDALVAYARRKLTEKRVDLVVANSADESFGREDDRATLVTKGAADVLPVMSKPALADVILDRVKRLLGWEASAS
jgi:phosphopantothenoylcysteine decarboxylase/phosphopantothenate--cysteine ligase